jgi:hypothetical protein
MKFRGSGSKAQTGAAVALRDHQGVEPEIRSDVEEQIGRMLVEQAEQCRPLQRFMSSRLEMPAVDMVARRYQPREPMATRQSPLPGHPPPVHGAHQARNEALE